MAKGKKETKKAAPKKATKKAKAPKKEEPKELRLTELERAQLDICERDVEIAHLNIENASAKLRNLEMDYLSKREQLRTRKRDAQAKYEQVVRIKNTKLAEVEFRLREIDSTFSFKDYLEQEDGTLIKAEDRIGALDPTAGDGEGGDSVTA